MSTDTTLFDLEDFDTDDDYDIEAEIFKPRRYSLEEFDDSDLPEYTDEEILSEEQVPSNTPQSDLIHYLLDVLTWLYRAQGWFIGNELTLVYSKRKKVDPDLMVCKGEVLTPEERRKQSSYRTYARARPRRRVPAVVFEISSKSTWEADLYDKPELYRRAGVKEYVAYDPQEPQLWPDSSTRLRGWRYIDGRMEEMTLDPRGWLWSQELDSWLVPDGAYLRLYDRTLQRRLTRAEAADQQAQAERVAKEATQDQLQALLEKLRKANIDPDKL